MKLILIIPAAGLLLTGAVSLDRYTARISSLTFAPAVERPAVPAAGNMWADRHDLFKGETFQLYFTTPHAPYLGVIDPAGKFFYVVFPAGDSMGKLRPLVSSEEFTGMNTLVIRTAAFTADPYTSGVLENRPVFTRSGTYRFILGENLHTDDERFVEIVEIKYRHKKRPVKKAVAFAAL